MDNADYRKHGGIEWRRRPESRARLFPEGPTFEKDLERLINKYSQEGGSDTPDFLLADYLTDCLATWNKSVRAREKWYGREPNLATTSISQG